MFKRNKLGIVSKCIRRSYSQYNYQYQQGSRLSFAQKLLYTTIGLTVVSGVVYYNFWPKHTFPSSVAKILRKGLWAESERGENDYQLALKYYIESLQHCQQIGMDPLTDEYTGIQLKIGEMYERLGLVNDAGFVYNEIATLYLSVLTAKPGSDLCKRIQSRQHRRHLIQKDLRIAIKLVELNKLNPQLSKAILITHLIIAQDEINKSTNMPNAFNFDQGNNGTVKAVLENNTIVINDELSNTEIARIEKTPEIWRPFTEEFFNAMDLLSAICISTGDLSMATKVKISMTEAMLLADVQPSKMLLSQCNLGSLLYMQAEEIEGQEITLKRKLSNLLNVEIEHLDIQKLKEDDKVATSDLSTVESLIKSRQVCINLAIKSYDAVLEFAKSLPQDIIKQQTEINETVALATYGLGVINLHLSNYDKAERLLRESRVRSKACEYVYLIPEIERELDKLFKEKKMIKNGINPNRLSKKSTDIEMDIHLK